MLDASTFAQLQSAHPALAGLPEKVKEMLRGELTPSETVESSSAVKVGGSAAAVLVTSQRLIAVWLTKMLVFFKFPTIQEFSFEQMNTVQVESGSVYLHASPVPGDREEDYEEGTFQFVSPDEAAAFAELVQGRSPRLAA
ncbi:MAG: hypothetical protein ACPG4T_14045 [Nannocystaceae bacterium]